MQIHVNATALRTLMNATAPGAKAGAASERAARITAHDDGITITTGTAYNARVSATADADVPPERPTQPARVPHDTLAALVDHAHKLANAITIDLGNPTSVGLAARADKHEFTATLNRLLDDEPLDEPSANDEAPAFTLHTTTNDLARYLEPEYAASRAGYDTNLRGVVLDAREGGITFVATDGTRLALATHQATADDIGIIAADRGISRAHARDIQHAIALAGAPACTVTINAARSHLTVAATTASPRIRITVPLDEIPQFPKYKRVIPRADARATIRVNREALLSAARRLTPLADPAQSHALAMRVAEAGGVVTLEAAGATATATERVPAEHNLPDETFMRVNGRYLADALAHFAGDEVDVQVTAVMAIRGVADADAGRVGIIAPMRE